MRRALALVLLLSAGCDASTTPPPGLCAPGLPTATNAPSFDTGTELGTTVAATVHVGVRVFGLGADREGFLNAALRKQALPITYEIAAAEGSCRQWLEAGYNCSTSSCSSDQICVAQSTCVDAPPSFGAGTLSVQADDTQADFVDTGLGIYYGALGDIAGCSKVSASAPGGAFPAFTLSTTLVPAMHLIDAETLHLVRGEALTVRWHSADPSTRVRVTLRADRGAHGELWSSIIECDVPDAAGSVTIPAAMTDRHLDELSCGFCPPSSVTRYRRVSRQPLGTPVELLIEDEVDLLIR